MAKRFSDTDKWKKPFMRGMPSAYKLLWIYILDECNHAGIWHVDLAVAELKIGEKIEYSKAIKYFTGKIIEFDGGEKWFIPDFIDFQYGEKLNPANRVHESVIKLLNKYKLLDSENKPLTSPLQGAKDKDKDKDKEKAKDKDKDPAPDEPELKIVSTHTRCRDFFVKLQTDNNRECNWSGRYASDLSNILKKLKVSFAKSRGREPTEEDLYDSFEYFINNLPGFFVDKPISTLNSSYDSIINQIKGGKQTTGTKQRAGHSAQEYAEAMARRRGQSSVANS